MPKIVRPVHAFETEIVRIKWTLADGSTYEEDQSIPPPDVRRARTQDAKYRDREPDTDTPQPGA